MVLVSLSVIIIKSFLDTHVIVKVNIFFFSLSLSLSSDSEFGYIFVLYYSYILMTWQI